MSSFIRDVFSLCYSSFAFYVLVVLVYLPTDWLESLLCKDAYLSQGDYLHKEQIEECLSFRFRLLFYVRLLTPPSGHIHNILHPLTARCGLCAQSAVKHQPTRLVVLQSGLGLESGLKSIFAGLGRGLGLGKICNQVQSQFSLCTFAVFCLSRMTFYQPVSRRLHTTKDLSVTYLIFTGELTHGLACSDSTYIVLISLLLVHTAIKDLDLKLVDLD